MFLNPVVDVLGLPIVVILPAIVIVLTTIGIAWLWRITRGPEDRDDHWRYRR